jgi:hypothetical protein
MPHPTLGLPPDDVTAGLPDAAARLRASKKRIAQLALQRVVGNEDGFTDRYGEDPLRLFLRDYDRHIEQLAKSMETANDSYLVNYAEWLVPVYRRRGVPSHDLIVMLGALKRAASTVLSPDEQKSSELYLHNAMMRVKHHQRLPGDHKGNSVIRFFWKGAGVGDDKWI